MNSNSKIPNWNNLPDIDSVAELAEKDFVCLKEIQAIIHKHKCSDIFGVTLLHKHFNLEPGEILFETQNIQNRTLHLEVRNINELQTNSIHFRATSWRFDENVPIVYSGCASGPYGMSMSSHYGYRDD